MGEVREGFEIRYLSEVHVDTAENRDGLISFMISTVAGEADRRRLSEVH